MFVADNKTGYLGVSLNNPSHPKPYRARVRRAGEMVGSTGFKPYGARLY